MLFMDLVLDDFINREGVLLVVAGVDVVSVVVDPHLHLVCALLERPVVSVLAQTHHGVRHVVNHPPIVLVTGPLVHVEAAWVVALGAAVAVGVADHDVPDGVGGVAVDSHVIVVEDADVGVVHGLHELDVTVGHVARVAAIGVVEHAVVDLVEELFRWRGERLALLGGNVVHVSVGGALFVEGELGDEQVVGLLDGHLCGLRILQCLVVRGGQHGGWDFELAEFGLEVL